MVNPIEEKVVLVLLVTNNNMENISASDNIFIPDWYPIGDNLIS